MTYYTVFVIDLASRRVQIAGSTPHPDGVFMQQVARTLTAADDGLLLQHRLLICDRDTRVQRSKVPIKTFCDLEFFLSCEAGAARSV